MKKVEKGRDEAVVVPRTTKRVTDKGSLWRQLSAIDGRTVSDNGVRLQFQDDVRCKGSKKGSSEAGKIPELGFRLVGPAKDDCR